MSDPRTWHPSHTIFIKDTCHRIYQWELWIREEKGKMPGSIQRRELFGTISLRARWAASSALTAKAEAATDFRNSGPSGKSESLSTKSFKCSFTDLQPGMMWKQNSTKFSYKRSAKCNKCGKKTQCSLPLQLPGPTLRQIDLA